MRIRRRRDRGRSSRKARSARPWLFAMALFAMIVAACGTAPESEVGQTGSPVATEGAGDDVETTSPADDTEPEMASVRVGYLPVVTYVFLWQAQEAGYFEEENLDVELVPMSGGVVIIGAVEAGELDFGGTDVLAAMNAASEGVPIKYVLVPSYISSETPLHGLMTNDPEVQSPDDLVGKQAAVNLLFNIEWMMLREWLRQNDVDPNAVDITEVPFPEMLEAVESRSVSAAGMADPFYRLSLQRGHRDLGQYWAEVVDEVALSGFVASETFLQENPDVAERFVRAVQRAVADVRDDEDLARRLTAENTEISQDVLERMNLPVYRTETDVGLMQFWFDQAQVESEFLDVDEELTPEDLVWQR